MPIDQKNIDRLIKCLAMMSSSSDGEALAASRKATKILKEANLQWKDVISITAPRSESPIAGSSNNHPGQQWQGFGTHQQQQYDAQRAAAEAFRQKAEMMRRQAEQMRQAQSPYMSGLGGGMYMDQFEVLRMMEMLRRAHERSENKSTK